MIKAIFFDWFNTLARYEPPREELHSQALREFGIEVSPEKILPGVLTADMYFFDENASSPVEKRDRKERAEVYTRYQKIILSEAGVKADQELLAKVLNKVEQLFKGITFTLFDDVLSTLETLKEQRFTLGLLTNLAQDMSPLCHKLGLESYLDFVVTSQQVGADKPEPPIFLAALDRAKVEASQAVHVGDQYKLDVVGARRVGINPILIDRYDLYPEVSDCSRIRDLTELAQYL
ncbi:Phosphoglycolate phosphatase [subsurface metagenome]